MKKHFYSHIVETDSVIVALSTMNISIEEKNHLIKIAESSLHHAVIDAILSELSEQDKKIFLLHVAQENNHNIWKLLNEKTSNIEKKIKLAADTLKKELHDDIKEVKTKKV